MKTFHRLTIIIIEIIIVVSMCFGQTNVSGLIDTDTIWTIESSPYIVVGNVLVNSNVTLTINPGVAVKFQSEKILQINGTLIARGSISSLINFTSTDETSSSLNWGYINFTDSSGDASFDNNGNYKSGSILEYCLIRYGGISGEGVITLTDANPFINHCTIQNNSAWGIYANIKSDLQIKNNIIGNNQGGIKVYGTSPTGGTITIDSNEITNNTNRGLRVGGNAIITNNTISSNTVSSPDNPRGAGLHVAGNVYISGNTIKDNISSSAGGGMHLALECSALIQNNIIFNNKALVGGGAISSWWSTELTIENNLIIGNETNGNGGGIYLGEENSAVSITNNIIVDNRASGHGGGISEESNPYPSRPKIEHNILFQNIASDASAIFYNGNEIYKHYPNNNFQFNTITKNSAIVAKMGPDQVM